jgi:hypothetical protein
MNMDGAKAEDLLSVKEYLRTMMADTSRIMESLCIMQGIVDDMLVNEVAGLRYEESEEEPEEQVSIRHSQPPAPEPPQKEPLPEPPEPEPQPKTEKKGLFGRLKREQNKDTQMTEHIMKQLEEEYNKLARKK